MGEDRKMGRKKNFFLTWGFLTNLTWGLNKGKSRGRKIGPPHFCPNNIGDILVGKGVARSGPTSRVLFLYCFQCIVQWIGVFIYFGRKCRVCLFTITVHSYFFKKNTYYIQNDIWLIVLINIIYLCNILNIKIIL